jgi:hypothetical protein
LQKLFGIAEVFEYQRDVHLGLAGKPFAAAIDAVLPDERQGISQEIEATASRPRDGPIIVS